MNLTLEDLRPEVKWFALLMEETLRKHDESKGGVDGWRKCGGDWLYERLLAEAQELENELNPTSKCNCREAGCPHTPWINLEGIVAEAVDVANFAMMIADNHRSLERYLASEGGVA